MIYPDEHIERWGRVYRAAPDLHDRVRFERFLARPDIYITDERARRLARAVKPNGGSR